MTHEPEDDFQTEVVARLKAAGFDCETNVYLQDSERFCDIVATNDVLTLAVEVENDFESVFTGIGQATLYAAELRAVPVVVVPDGHTKEPEWSLMKRAAGPFMTTL